MSGRDVADEEIPVARIDFVLTIRTEVTAPMVGRRFLGLAQLAEPRAIEADLI